MNPKVRALFEFIRETGLSPEQAVGMRVRGDSITVSGRKGQPKHIRLTAVAREALTELGGRMPWTNHRQIQKYFQKQGTTARDWAQAASTAPGLGDLHPRLESRVRRTFQQGEYELTVFAAVREVEIRVRELAEAPDTLLGVDLMKQALRKEGPLTDPGAVPAEQEALMALFWGAIGTFKNPSSHRRVQFEDPAFVRGVIILADLLHRVLDQVEDRAL